MNPEFRPVYEAGGSLPIRLEVADVEHPPGRRYLHHRLVVADGRPGVVIVARRAGELLLVLSERRGAGREMWEFPRGSGEAEDAGGEDEYGDGALIRAGSRELREETGWTAREPEVIGRYLTDSTVFPQRVGVVACEIDPADPRGETDGEIDDVRWVSDSQLEELVRDGVVIDAHTLSALALLRARRDR